MTEDKDNGMTNSNGTPGGEGTAVTFALDEGYQFGLGVFETINLTGGRLVMLDRHLDRLRRAEDLQPRPASLVTAEERNGDRSEAIELD